MTFNKLNVIRIAGLLAALASATVSALSGDWATAGGLVGAALSAAGLKTTYPQQ